MLCSLWQLKITEKAMKSNQMRKKKIWGTSHKPGAGGLTKQKEGGGGGVRLTGSWIIIS